MAKANQPPLGDSDQAGPGQDSGERDTREPPFFTHEDVADLTFQHFHKRHVTAAVRVQGPFGVRTPSGDVECADGWLAIDARGFPYPIDADEFARIYELVEDPRAESIGEGSAAERYASQREWMVRELRDRFAAAILQNPSAERFCYGSPLDQHKPNGFRSVGELLAASCSRLASEYFDAALALDVAQENPAQTTPA